jgi:hypothetical protein
MTETENKYANGKIYKITSKQTDKVYIGSTTRKLYIRFNEHKKDFRKWKNNTYNYVSSYEILKYYDAQIELIEDYNCASKEELHKREGYVILNTANCINKAIMGRTKAEISKATRLKNRERIQERKSRVIHCLCGCKATSCHFRRHERTPKHVMLMNEIFNPDITIAFQVMTERHSKTQALLKRLGYKPKFEL